METYLKTAFSAFLIIIVISSCNSQDKNHPRECIDLNNNGVKYLMDYPMNGEKELDKAIGLFKDAISCDSTNVVFYFSLGSAYNKKHNYNGEMVVIDKILTLTANDPAILTQKSMLLEVKGSIDSAKREYQLTNDVYLEKLAKHPADGNLIRGWILLKAIINGKEDAVKELDRQIKLHPQLSSELSNEYYFYKDFNRHNYVFGLPTEIDLDK